MPKPSETVFFDNLTVNNNLVVQSDFNSQFLTFDNASSTPTWTLPVTFAAGSGMLFKFDSVCIFDPETTIICNGTAQFGKTIIGSVSGSAASVPASGITGTSLPAGIVSSNLSSVGILNGLRVAGNVSTTGDNVAAIGSATNRFSDLFLGGKLCCGTITDSRNSNIATSQVLLNQSLIPATLSVNLGSVVFPFGNVFTTNVSTNLITNRNNSAAGSQIITINQSLAPPSPGICTLGSATNWFAGLTSDRVTTDQVTSRTTNGSLTLSANGTGSVLWTKTPVAIYTNTSIQTVGVNSWTILSTPLKVNQYGPITCNSNVFSNTGSTATFKVNVRLGWQTTGATGIIVGYQLSGDNYAKRYYLETRTVPADVGALTVAFPVTLQANAGFRIVVLSKTVALTLNPTSAGIDLASTVAVTYLFN